MISMIQCPWIQLETGYSWKREVAFSGPSLHLGSFLGSICITKAENPEQRNCHATLRLCGKASKLRRNWCKPQGI